MFAYGGDGIAGALTAGRWVGDGSTSAPSDPTIIDDVFSHGDIMAQILAGTSASTDPDKGRIRTIGSIGNAGGKSLRKETRKSQNVHSPNDESRSGIRESSSASEF